MNVILPVFSARLKELRQKSGLTQRKMGDLIGKTERHYQAIEAGKVNVSATMLIFFAQEFHVSVDYLLGLSDKPQLDGGDREAP